ncbi:hypothetical protein Pyn_28431 [Prunus yedoensis var. nudiflora]|uniref:Uncharacterized protein n=1 Tax=Prunus yedoensis var. nudiflora TaxID=2094558 RepID=A0A314V3R6_PRUYE|nr:hypothetical protein Pyn_28431 [Prunus yedoensis var. nudiflora]
MIWNAAGDRTKNVSVIGSEWFIIVFIHGITDDIKDKLTFGVDVPCCHTFHLFICKVNIALPPQKKTQKYVCLVDPYQLVAILILKSIETRNLSLCMQISGAEPKENQLGELRSGWYPTQQPHLA